MRTSGFAPVVSTAASVPSRPVGGGATRSVATRSPRPMPVASRMMTLRTPDDAVLRDVRKAGSRKVTTMSAGTSSVPTTNHFERTRSRYSRLMTTQSLSTNGLARCAGTRRLGAGRLDGRDIRGADALEEDLMQGWVHELESLDGGTRVDELSEQSLRVGTGGELDLEGTVRVVDAGDERPIL